MSQPPQQRVIQTTRRHPLCPYCGYDLVATVADGKRICPECGSDFALSDLQYQQFAGDWTFRSALTRGVGVIFARAILASLVWAIAADMSNLMHVVTNLTGLIPLIIGTIAGYLMGRVYSENLEERAGFTSMLLVLGCLVCAMISVMFAQVLVELLLPSASAYGRMILIGSGLI